MEKKNAIGRMKMSFIATALLVGVILAPAAATYADDTLTAAEARAIARDTALAETEKPRLILQITVDQLRGDLPARFLDRMGEGGFRYLLEEGIVYGNAHHAHANTETIVGHATLATGAHLCLANCYSGSSRQLK